MRTPITYYGGKQTMLKHILPLIPPHKIYTEAFCGGAAVLFAKEPSEAEIINDVNSELVNFYRVAQCHYSELKMEIDCTLHSRELHNHAAYIYAYPHMFTAVQRAWAIWTLCKMSYASKLEKSFGYDFHGRVPRRVAHAKEDITTDVCLRLQQVTIENDDALNVIHRYDSANTFHFVDPPYIDTPCGHYRGFFNENDLSHLLNLLKTVEGKFMLTSYPLDIIKVYAENNNWHIYPIKRTLNASKTRRRYQEEWIVCNYDNLT